MQYWINSLKITLSALGLLISFSTFAQENSPYSRYGIGNLKQEENAANRGMGGVSIADDNPLIANPTNPATYASLKLTSYSVGMEGARVNIKNAGNTYQTGSAGFHYVTIGLPVGKKIGVSFGLLPLSRVRYNMERIDTLDFANATSSFVGGGGLQNVYVGAAYKHDIYSVGLNLGYTFGSFVNGTEKLFTDTNNILPTNFDVRTNAGGLYYQLGGLMNKKINEIYAINFGITYTGAQNLKATRDSKYEFIRNNSSNDTVYFIENSTNGRIKLPAKFSIGTMLVHGDRWQIGADFKTSDWSKFKSFDEKDSLAQTWIFKFGGAFTPDPNAVNEQWKKMTFRAGFYFGKDILSLKNIHTNKAAFTLGASYPIRRTNLSIGQLNAALEVGRRGAIESGLVREAFTRLTVGITFNDKWFIKRRYD
jgi:hypothetical protein